MDAGDAARPRTRASVPSTGGGAGGDKGGDVELGVASEAAAKGPAPQGCCNSMKVMAAITVAAVVMIAVAPLYASSRAPRWLMKAVNAEEEIITGSSSDSSSAPAAQLQLPPPLPPPWCDSVAAGLMAAGAGSVGAAAVARAVELYNTASAAVAAASPKPHYAAMYRSQEYKYWGPQLPSWMVVHTCGMASAGTPAAVAPGRGHCIRHARGAAGAGDSQRLRGVRYGHVPHPVAAAGCRLEHKL